MVLVRRSRLRVGCLGGITGQRTEEAVGRVESRGFLASAAVGMGRGEERPVIFKPPHRGNTPISQLPHPEMSMRRSVLLVHVDFFVLWLDVVFPIAGQEIYPKTAPRASTHTQRSPPPQTSEYYSGSPATGNASPAGTVAPFGNPPS